MDILLKRMSNIGRNLLNLNEAAADFDLPPSRGTTRLQVIKDQQRRALIDRKFRSLVQSSDDARDQRQWELAANGYRRALDIYPFHSSYRVQYAHMLKEQGDVLGAELNYRSAVSVGAEAHVVDEHLSFVARINGVDFKRNSHGMLEVPELDAPPTIMDVEAFSFLLWRQSGVSALDALPILRTCITNEQAVCQMIADERFARANSGFLSMYRD